MTLEPRNDIIWLNRIVYRRLMLIVLFPAGGPACTFDVTRSGFAPRLKKGRHAKLSFRSSARNCVVFMVRKSVLTDRLGSGGTNG